MIVSCTYLHINVSGAFYKVHWFLSVVPRFHLMSFSFHQKELLLFTSCHAGLLVVNSLFVYLKMAFFGKDFFKDKGTGFGREFWVDCSFLSPLKRDFLCFLGFIFFWREVLWYFYLCTFLWNMSYVSLAAFNILRLAFSSLIMTDVIVFVFILLLVHWDNWIWS